MSARPNLPSTVGALSDLLTHDPALIRWLNWHGFEIVSGDQSTYRMRRSRPPGPRFDHSTGVPIPEPICPPGAERLIKTVPMEAERYEVSDAELADAEEDFSSYLWGIYAHVMDGELEPEQFVKQQLAIDLSVEFEESDRETRKEIIADVLAMYLTRGF